jgi:hypothetical protein
MRKFYLFFIFFFFVQLGCTEGCNVRGIEVSQEIIDGGDMKGINYCLLLGKSLDGNTSCIREFSTIDTFEGGFIYVHGVYLIRLIDRIGENSFVNAFEGTSREERIKIDMYINAGMDIYETYYTGSDAIEYTSIDDFWEKHPLILAFLNTIH